MPTHKTIVNPDQLSDFLLYTTPNGDVKVEIFFRDESVWLTQDRMSLLFDIDRTVITKHIKNIYIEGELEESSTSAKFAQVQIEGNRNVSRDIIFYNLDIIIAVGYRVNSKKATQFRIRATKILKDYMIKGFSMDDDRLKNGQYFGKDYFKELLERIRSIRASERRIYQQITDIFAECSIDYDPKADATKNFYAMVQNKFHFAITGQTAAEIVYNTASSTEKNMGLQTRKNSPAGRILKSDATVAKNYLIESDIKKLERTIASYFDYIERLIENHTSFTMEQLAESVNKFLEFNEYKILEGKGSISSKKAENKAKKEYDEFSKYQKIESDFDKLIKKLKYKK